MIISYTATEYDTGRKVYSIMRRELRVSAALTRRLKTVGAISVSGAPVFTDYRLTPGEIVNVDVGAAEPPCDNMPEHGELDVLFENEGLLAVNKPMGMLVHPSRSKNTGTLANHVAGYLETGGSARYLTEELSPRGTSHVVNRLDRDTSGVVLFAKNSYMKSLAVAALADTAALKEYLAIVSGEMPRGGVMDAPISRPDERNMLRVVSPDGQRAVTHYETVDVRGTTDGCAVSLVRLRLETGRTHQIRVHCLHSGHPVLGDKLYSTEDSRELSGKLGITTQALHARRLGFTEPLSRQYMEIEAPPPPVFTAKFSLHF